MLLSHKIGVAVALEIAFLQSSYTGYEKTLYTVTDSLAAIEVNNWTRQNLAVEVIMAEASEVRAVGGLAGLYFNF